VPGPILNRLELKRLPFARRPIPEPGTTLVFQMPDNRLIEPNPPYTAGETWWKGPKAAYVVDSRPHGAVFTCTLPSRGDAVFFDATVQFTWRVSHAVEVVREQVTDPEAECETYLAKNLPTITRRHEYNQPAAAEADVSKTVGQRTLPLLGRGVQIEAVHALLRIDQEQIDLFRKLHAAPHQHQYETIQARHSLTIDEIRRTAMNEIVSGGPERLYGFILQQDPARGMEVVTQMQAMADRDKQRAIEAIKVLIDGEEIRLGELDGAVAAAVEGFRKILGQYAGPAPAANALPSADAAKDESA
jgi:hypothetical protein